MYAVTTGGGTVSVGASGIGYGNNGLISAGISHSTTVNNQQVTINVPGLYFFEYVVQGSDSNTGNGITYGIYDREVFITGSSYNSPAPTTGASGTQLLVGDLLYQVTGTSVISVRYKDTGTSPYLQTSPASEVAASLLIIKVA